MHEEARDVAAMLFTNGAHAPQNRRPRARTRRQDLRSKVSSTTFLKASCRILFFANQGFYFFANFESKKTRILFFLKL